MTMMITNLEITPLCVIYMIIISSSWFLTNDSFSSPMNAKQFEEDITGIRLFDLKKLTGQVGKIFVASNQHNLSIKQPEKGHCEECDG